MADPVIGDDERFRGVTALAIAFLFIGLSFIFVALRLYTRIFLVRNVSATDWKILAAWVSSLAVGVSIVFQVRAGSGSHMDNLRPDQITAMLRAVYPGVIIYQFGLGLTKCSILSQYMRIFPAKHMQRLIKGAFWLTLCYIITTVAGCIFFCVPVYKFWEGDAVPGKCIDMAGFFFFAAAFNIITDLIIFLLPMPELRKLQISKRQRIALMGVFGVGLLVCIISVVRLIPIHRFVYTADKTYFNSDASYSSVIELCTGIICACMPSLKAFADRFFPALMAKSTGSSSGGKATGSGGKISGSGGNAHGSPAIREAKEREAKDSVTPAAVVPLKVVRTGSMKGGRWTDDNKHSYAQQSDAEAQRPTDELKFNDKQIRVMTVLEQGWESSDEENLERAKGGQGWSEREVQDMV